MSATIREEGFRNCFTMIPNIIDDMELSHIAFRLYVHMRRRTGESEAGRCWESTENLAKSCGMSTGSVSKAKRELERAGLIRIEEVDSGRGQPAHSILIVDIWDKNTQKYRNSSSEAGGSSGELYRSSSEIKEEPIKKNPILASQEISQSVLTEEDKTFFEKGVDRAKENAQRPKLSLEERRQSTLKALERSLTNSGADLAQYPEHLRAIARAFIEESKVVPFNNERKYWIKGLTDIYERGFDPLLVIRAVRKMRDDHLTIKSPQSIVAVAQELAIRSMQLDEDRRFSEEY